VEKRRGKKEKEEGREAGRWIEVAAQEPPAGLLGGDGVGEAAAAQDAAALTLGGTTPDTVVDVVLEGVFEARLRDRALGTDPLGHEHAHPVTREEKVRCNFLALAPGHPIGIHCSAPLSRTILREVPVGS
jgi:hypothetical protein